MGPSYQSGLNSSRLKCRIPTFSTIETKHLPPICHFCQAPPQIRGISPSKIWYTVVQRPPGTAGCSSAAAGGTPPDAPPPQRETAAAFSGLGDPAGAARGPVSPGGRKSQRRHFLHSLYILSCSARVSFCFLAKSPLPSPVRSESSPLPLPVSLRKKYNLFIFFFYFFPVDAIIALNCRQWSVHLLVGRSSFGRDAPKQRERFCCLPFFCGHVRGLLSGAAAPSSSRRVHLPGESGQDRDRTQAKQLPSCCPFHPVL